MKVYVSELPKSCEKCKFYECETELVGEWGMENHRHICKINGSLIQGICPLQPLTEYTKQVRKEILREIDYSALRKMTERPNDLCYKDALCEYFLDQIQGVEDGTINNKK